MNENQMIRNKPIETYDDPWQFENPPLLSPLSSQAGDCDGSWIII